MIHKAHHPNILALTIILENTTLDDYFRLVKPWLIAQGKDFFEKALENPEQLVDVLDNKGFGNHITEAFYNFSLAERAFMKKYCPIEIPDEKLPSSQKRQSYVSKKLFENITESNEFKKNLAKLFPKLCEEFDIEDGFYDF